ncbi:hypothetical protein IFR05_010905 [Cadophora sp. M221]|nr:hypothetical protein IFR05_010905 [Cadophora sp. M221]
MFGAENVTMEREEIAHPEIEISVCDHDEMEKIIEGESFNEFLTYIDRIANREILSPEQAIDMLYWYRRMGYSHNTSPSLKLAAKEAEAILARGPDDRQADIALQWVSALQAIWNEGCDYITYDNEENKFSFLITLMNRHSDYVHLDIKTPLILPKPEKKETPKVNANSTTTEGPDARPAPTKDLPSHGTSSNSSFTSKGTGGTQWPAVHPGGKLTPPNSFKEGTFDHNIWTTEPSYSFQTMGIFLFEGGFDTPAEIQEISESNERVTRWLKSTDLEAVSEWDAHERATKYEFSTEGDLQDQETAWINARDRYNEHEDSKESTLGRYLAYLGLPSTQ